jgi:hypothetical protein
MYVDPVSGDVPYMVTRDANHIHPALADVFQRTDVI